MRHRSGRRRRARRRARTLNFSKASTSAMTSSRTGCASSGRTFASGDRAAPRRLPPDVAPMHAPSRTLSTRTRCFSLRRTLPIHSEASIVADSLLDAVAKSVVELGVAKVYDRRWRIPSSDRTNPTKFRSQRCPLAAWRFFDTEAKKIVRLAILQIPENSLAWSSTLQLSNERGQRHPRSPRDGLHQSCGQCCGRPVLEEQRRTAGTSRWRRRCAIPASLHLFQAWPRSISKLPIGCLPVLRDRTRAGLSRLAGIPEHIPPRRAAIHGPSKRSSDEAFDLRHRALEMEPHNLICRRAERARLQIMRRVLCRRLRARRAQHPA